MATLVGGSGNKNESSAEPSWIITATRSRSSS